MTGQPVDLAGVPERLLAKLWRQRASGARLQADDGRGVRVVYGGRPGGGPGPDFRDALVWLSGRLLRGDVELHRRAGAWRQHGHHRDLAYGGVVLHGVAQGQGEQVARRADGGAVAQVELRPLGSLGPSRPPRPWGHLAGLPPDGLAAALDQAGRARFLERSAAFARRGAQYGEAQELYASLLEALGYSENREPFRELAGRVPLALIGSATRAASADTSFQGCRDVVEELLLSGSGLWETCSLWHQLMGGTPLNPGQWRWVGVRPANHPVRRIRGAAVLVARMVVSGPYRWLAAMVRDDRPETLVEGLSVTDSLDWYGALVGHSRASDLAVNVALPSVHAAARRRGDRALAARSLQLYLRFPALQENVVTREARRLLGPPARAVPMTACRQQGLHHLYRKMLGAAPRADARP